MASTILPFLGWTFLPDFATNHLHTFYYNLTIPAGSPKPPPGSPQFLKDRRRVYFLVIFTYLLYTLYEAHWEVQRAGNFYTDLGVPFDVDEKALQSRFRRLTVKHHPDKITDAAARPAAEAYYVHIKLARDTLVDPAKRFAYDRFGPSVTEWKHCETIRDFALTGLKAMGPWYSASFVGMFIMQYLGFFDWGTYWRYLAFAALGLFELHTITRPSSVSLFPAFAHSLWQYTIFPRFAPQYLPFQTLQVAHRAIITFFIALQRLGPLLSDPNAVSPGDESEAAMSKQLQRLEQLVNANGMEATRLLGLDLVPFRADGDVKQEGRDGDDGAGGGQLLKRLKQKLKGWFVTNYIRNEPEVKSAVERVMQRRSEEATVAHERAYGRPA